MDLEQLSPVNRPMIIRELAMVFRMRPDRLRRLAARWGIRPACRIANVSMYGPVQIRKLYQAVVHECGPLPGTESETEPGTKARPRSRTSPKASGRKGPRVPRR